MNSKRIACFVALLVFVGWTAPAKAQTSLPSAVLGSGATKASGGPYTLRGTIGQPVAGGVAGAAYRNGQGFWPRITGSGGAPAVLYASLRAFLEGPYADSGTMNTALNTGGHLAAGATSPPYTMPPWSYPGSESVPSAFFAAHPNVVDWLYVQLRTGEPDGPAMNVAAETVAFLLADGTVVDVDGQSKLGFDGVGAGAYYVVLDHRNHLAVLSSQAVPLGSSPGAAGPPYDYDFTDGPAKAFGTNALRTLGDGFYGLYAGDGNGDGNVFNDDLIGSWLPAAGSSGYLPADFNLDGNVFNSDLIGFWLGNAGMSTQVPPVP